ncbi:hypothetical protein O1M54_18425 [Streptomyces diastatochromogenes]|nr:hypothetical protein [Streptomyces diastatochromogenes]
MSRPSTYGTVATPEAEALAGVRDETASVPPVVRTGRRTPCRPGPSPWSPGSSWPGACS